MTEIDRRIAIIAAQHDGLVARWQMRAAGLHDRTLEGRARRGSMRRLHPGVYLNGCGEPTLRQRLRAALLYVGEDGVLSHLSAAALLGLAPAGECASAVSVTVRQARARSRPGITVHRSRTLMDADIRTRQGLRVTSATRTLFDLAAAETQHTLEAVFTEAIAHGLTSAAEIRRRALAAPSTKGVGRVIQLLELEQENGYTRSQAERLLRALLKPSGLSMPRFNVLTEGHLADCRWDAQRLILFVDGFRTHGQRAAFEADRRCDQELVAAGWRVIRVTWRQLTGEPLAVLAHIAQALAIR